VSDFCQRYNSLWLDPVDLRNLSTIRKNFKTKYKVTIDKYIDYHTNNAKEFDLCQ
jgi:hypothetical protein